MLDDDLFDFDAQRFRIPNLQLQHQKKDEILARNELSDCTIISG